MILAPQSLPSQSTWNWFKFTGAKRIALLAILTHADFVDSPSFRSQVAFLRVALEQDPEDDMTHRDVRRALGCHHHSIQ
jgi:hypothetical protein